MADARIAFDKVMKWEGWVLEKTHGDDGGETCCGITRKYQPDSEVWKIVDAERTTGALDKNILCLHILREAVYRYYRDRFVSLQLQDLKSQKMANQIYQAVINCGFPPIKWAQEYAGVTADGVIGPITVGALNACDADSFSKVFCARQIAHYEDIVTRNPNQGKFLAGWTARAKAFA